MCHTFVQHVQKHSCKQNIYDV
uniref:Uncharacterized protein n=1 Tax=Arundo donax TaxID=35708 RepID=A0A0A9GLC5_ARUDO